VFSPNTFNILSFNFPFKFNIRSVPISPATKILTMYDMIMMVICLNLKV
jgi:hypothetical protein